MTTPSASLVLTVVTVLVTLCIVIGRAMLSDDDPGESALWAIATWTSFAYVALTWATWAMLKLWCAL